MLWSLSPLVDALVEADDLAGADAALTAARQQAAPPAGALAAPLLLQSRARLRLAQHRPEDALADARDGRRRARELGMRHAGVRELARRGDRSARPPGRGREARAARTRAARAREQLGTPGARGAALRVLARTATEPIPLLERAVERWPAHRRGSSTRARWSISARH